MGRSLSIVIAWAVLGAMLNIAIAFVCAWRSEPRTFDAQFMAQIRREFFNRDDADGGRAFWPLIAYRGVGAQFIHIAIDEPNLIEDSISGSYPCLGVVRAGWPCMALEGEYWHDATRAVAPGPTRVSGALVIRGQYASADRLFLPRMLPLRPRWTGFAVNSVMLALLLWFAWLAVRTTRRTVRKRRGQCPWCAYPMGVSNRCSECGRELGRRAAKLSA